MDLTPGDNPRDLTLTRAESVIDGTVEKAGVPQIGAGVLLLPKAASYAAVRSDQTDSDGSYHLGTIPAGDYFLITVPDRESIAYRDAKVAAALSKAAKPIHVEPGDRLNLKLDPVDPATLNLPAQ